MRKAFFNIFFLLSALWMLSGCASAYQITGASSLRGLEGGMLYLVGQNGERLAALDSTSVEHGMFRMEGSVDSVQMVTLYMYGEGIMPIILEGGNIKVRISNQQLTASGTPLNDQLYKFIEERNEMGRKLNSLQYRESQLKLTGGFNQNNLIRLQKEQEKVLGQLSEYTRSFIKKNYKNVLGPSMFMMVNATLPYPMLTDDIQDILLSAPKEFLQNAYVKDFVEKAYQNESILETSPFMEFSIRESFEINTYGW